MSFADRMPDEMVPDHNDIRLTGTSDQDAPIIKAVRIYGSRIDRDGAQLRTILESDDFDINARDKVCGHKLACGAV